MFQILNILLIISICWLGSIIGVVTCGFTEKYRKYTKLYLMWSPIIILLIWGIIGIFIIF